jgi:N-acetylglucosaminyldiphosphoundecaprenol N-acetyl-beta-D-mannosaminyltransferase
LQLLIHSLLLWQGGFLNEDRFHQIATVNPEFILGAQKDADFRKILNDCDLNVADGMGIKLAFWRWGEKLRYRMAGIDLMQEILKIANRRQLKVFLAANSRGLSFWKDTALAIGKNYPDLEIDGENLEARPPFRGLASKRIEADIVFCNFGVPFQEKFLNFQKNGKIKLAVGVGGSFDYLTGKLKRAPKWMQFFGVEWFWRLMLQPKRIKRIWSAVIVFTFKIICLKKEK